MLTDKQINLMWLWGLCPPHLIHKLHSCADFESAILTSTLGICSTVLFAGVSNCFGGLLHVMHTPWQPSTAVKNRARKLYQITRKLNSIYELVGDCSLVFSISEYSGWLQRTCKHFQAEESLARSFLHAILFLKSLLTDKCKILLFWDYTHC